jgi:glutamate N-acetyltransferase / amino-acid N-acetyltransferase
VITTPAGFRASAVAAGIKPGRDDMALIVADRPCAAAAVFTQNRVVAAPIEVSREHLRSGRARAIVVNAGCANAATGAAGLRDAREMAARTAEAVGCAPEEVVVASTGVIGVPLPMDKVRDGIARAARALSATGGEAAARAILTTDTRPKTVDLEIPLGDRTVRLSAMAKGAGMIAPNMATLLAFFTTDAAVAPDSLQRGLRDAVGESLNRITVDGDTSTNDMAVILASGASEAPMIDGEGAALGAFREGLTEAARRLALMIVRDGEGAMRIAEIRVEGAGSAAEADRIARTVAESPLVKTALHGGDPNWGRILAAAGRSGVEFDVARLDIFIGAVWVAEGGSARAYDEATAALAMREDPVRLRLRLNAGAATGSIWTCDLTRGYVDINAHYRS